MNIKKLEDFLMLGEGQKVEFKSYCRDPKTIARCVCGFLNASGGYIVCGVDDKGKIVGIADPKNARASLIAELQKSLSPQTLVSVEIQAVESKSILFVEVPAGKDIPYAFQNTIYIRSGDKTAKADIETIRDMVLRKQVEPERWERRFSSADIEHDIDVAEVKNATRAIVEKQKALFRNLGEPYQVLEDLSVAKLGRLTNGGDVLFGLAPGKRYPQVRVRAACFFIDKTSDTYGDMKFFDGPLFPVLEQVFNFIVQNTQTTVSFSRKGLQRKDESVYPDDAIREGLVNAFAHRDYADSSGGITISIYPRRLEIWNSGCLPKGITPENLIHGNLSILRNPDIAHVLYLRGLMEKIGRGAMLILKSCKDRSLPAPKWISEEKTGVKLTFFAPETVGIPPKRPSRATQLTTQSSDPVERLLLALQSGEQSPENLRQKVKIKHRPTFRKNYLHPALEKGFIESTRPEKPTSRSQKYRLTDKGRQELEGLSGKPYINPRVL